MEYIENQIYYHIQKEGSPKRKLWDVGYSTFIGDHKNPFASKFDITGFHEVDVENIVDVLVHYQQFSRETIFEEVRQKHFPDFPSRLNCLWVIRDNEETIEYWKEELSDNGEFQNSRLLRLELTGKIHKTNQSHLSLNFKPFNNNRGSAFKYWTGAPDSESLDDEYLFQGFIEVLDVVDL